MTKTTTKAVVAALKTGLYERTELPLWVKPAALPLGQFAIFFMKTALPILEYIFELKDGELALMDVLGHFYTARNNSPFGPNTGPKRFKKALYYVPLPVGKRAFELAEELMERRAEEPPPVVDDAAGKGERQDG